MYGTLTSFCVQQDTLLLEPYGRKRDVAYFVVCPETEFIRKQTIVFFQALSQQYERCRFGRHRPIVKSLRDGIMRVKAQAQDLKVDEWFDHCQSNPPIVAKLKLYAQACKNLG